MMNHTHPTYPPRRVQGKLLATSYHSVFVSACTTHHATGEPGEQNSENGEETGEEIVPGELYRVCRGVGNISSSGFPSQRPRQSSPGSAPGDSCGSAADRPDAPAAVGCTRASDPPLDTRPPRTGRGAPSGPHESPAATRQPDNGQGRTRFTAQLVCYKRRPGVRQADVETAPDSSGPAASWAHDESASRPGSSAAPLSPAPRPAATEDQDRPEPAAAG